MIDTETPPKFHVETYLSDREYRRYATIEEPLKVRPWSDRVARGIVPVGSRAKLLLVADSAPQHWFIEIIEQVSELYSLPGKLGWARCIED